MTCLMRSLPTKFALAMTLVLAGCSTAPVSTWPQSTPPQESATPKAAPREAAPAPRSTVDVDTPLRPRDAALRWRWIGIKTNVTAPCPSPATTPGTTPWDVRELFDHGSGTMIPPSLRRFCLYERATAAGISELRDLVTNGLLTGVDTDRMVVSALGSDLQDATWRPSRDFFLSQTGFASLPSTGSRPRLAILDTGATRESGAERFRGSSQHGYTLVNMARDLLCGGGSCLAEVTSQLTLAYMGYHPENRELCDRNESEGGYLGTLGELAEAIRQEVDAWETSGSADRLVINLSLGWHPRFGGLEARVRNMPEAVQPVYEALADATCRGALVVSAAGNAGGGPEDETGPLLPAAWETRLAPGFAACASRLGSPPGAADFPTTGRRAYRPLVYAAGGVAASGHPLFNSREEGTPRLAAYADHGVAEASGGSTSMMTGTSVSSLVVSAAAAAVWHYRPSLAPHQVMDLLHDAGHDLDREADFCLGGRSSSCPDDDLDTHAVSVCAAVRLACSGGHEDCPSASSLPTCTSWSEEGPDFSAVDTTSLTGTTVDLDDDITRAYSPMPSICGGETLLYSPTSLRPTDPCPHHQYYGLPVEPWTDPQPSSNPCPSCWVGGPPPSDRKAGTSTLYLEIDGDFTGDLTDATLKIDSDTYNLGLGTLSSGSKAVVEDLPAISKSSTVTLAFTRDGDQSVTSPVLVVELP